MPNCPSQWVFVGQMCHQIECCNKARMKLKLTFLIFSFLFFFSISNRRQCKKFGSELKKTWAFFYTWVSYKATIKWQGFMFIYNLIYIHILADNIRASHAGLSSCIYQYFWGRRHFCALPARITHTPRATCVFLMALKYSFECKHPRCAGPVIAVK